MQAIIGVVLFILVAWLLSENRHKFPWRFATAGLGLHFVLAATLLSIPSIKSAFRVIDSAAGALKAATAQATSLVFGYVGGGPTPFEVSNAGTMIIFAFQILPQLIILSAIFAVLWHWGVLQVLIRSMAFVLQRVFRISGALGLGAASNVFLGMVEAPLVIRPYLKTMSRQEFFALMTCGMATISGTVLLLYATLLSDLLENPFSHLFVASVIAVPAALIIARIMVPAEANAEAAELPKDTQLYESTMDALAKGTQNGLTLFFNVLSMVLVFVALVALLNLMLGVLPEVGGTPLTIEGLLGWAFAPVAWCMGLPFDQAIAGGQLLGVKLVLTEFVAFLKLSEMPAGMLDARSTIIMTYALAGFANIVSLGIMIGGLSVIVPERRADILKYVPRAVVAGTLASCLSATVVGLVVFAGSLTG